MSDNDANSPVILADLHAQLATSRQQQERLKEALTRVLSLIDDLETP